MVHLKVYPLRRINRIAEAVNIPISEGITELPLKAMDAIAPTTIPPIQDITMLGKTPFIVATLPEGDDEINHD